MSSRTELLVSGVSLIKDGIVTVASIPLFKNEFDVNEHKDQMAFFKQVKKKIIIIGFTGTGKSTLCNIIYGDKKFESGGSIESVTKGFSVVKLSVISTKTIKINDKDREVKSDDENWALVDSRGLGETKDLSKELGTIRKYINEIMGGVDIVIMVVAQTRGFDLYASVIKEISSKLKLSEYADNFMIVMTKCSKKEEPGMSLWLNKIIANVTERQIPKFFVNLPGQAEYEKVGMEFDEEDYLSRLKEHRSKILTAIHDHRFPAVKEIPRGCMIL